MAVTFAQTYEARLFAVDVTSHVLTERRRRMTQTLWIACGGALGSVARYWIALWASPVSRTLPLGTIGINIAGSFLIGFFGTLLILDRLLWYTDLAERPISSTRKYQAVRYGGHLRWVHHLLVLQPANA